MPLRPRGCAVNDPQRAPPARPQAQGKSMRAAEQGPDVAAKRRRAWQRFMDPARFVFLDETGTATNMARRYPIRCSWRRSTRSWSPPMGSERSSPASTSWFAIRRAMTCRRVMSRRGGRGRAQLRRGGRRPGAFRQLKSRGACARPHPQPLPVRRDDRRGVSTKAGYARARVALFEDAPRDDDPRRPLVPVGSWAMRVAARRGAEPLHIPAYAEEVPI
jgi:hypothetical protein